jgi:uracil-DNA glycosylase
MSFFTIEDSWDRVLENEYQAPYFNRLAEFVREERAVGKNIFPPKGQTFQALKLTPFDKVKVVIVGQDPYHGEGQAHGLSFSVPKGVRPPPSLQNIFKELHADLGIPIPQHGCLEKWAEQGVLLLNALLSVEEGKPLSHKNLGWERFTDTIIQVLACRQEPVIFLLWGKNACDKCKNVEALQTQKQHVILTAPHPSPFSAHSGFLGCRHFSKTNAQLKEWGKTPIDWQLD